MEKVHINTGRQLKDYELESALIHEIYELRSILKSTAERFPDSTIWMINSTSQGGGVAEMLPGQITIQRELGLKMEWLVMQAEEKRFFEFTKQIHNAIHGKGDPTAFNEDNKAVYEEVNRINAEEALKLVKDGDIVVIHDPQPAAMAKLIREKRDVKLIWRCHIGLETDNAVTNAVWGFLKPYLEQYDRFVFSVKEYVPEYLDMNSVDIIPPAIDPLSAKNRILSVHEVVGIFHQAGMVSHLKELVHPLFEYQVARLQKDGSIGPALDADDLQLPYRPVITQISRWDHLKGFVPLMKAFALLKKKGDSLLDQDSYAARWIGTSRLVLGGPDLNAVHDDPEGMEVLNSIIDEYKSLPEEIRGQIAILLLPMQSLHENMLIVNALQSVSNIVVQNSLQEGFGLTATEAMWKQVPMLISNATGLRQQVTDGVEGRMNPEPENPELLMNIMYEMVHDSDERKEMGRRGKLKVVSKFNVISQLIMWGRCWEKL